MRKCQIPRTLTTYLSPHLWIGCGDSLLIITLEWSSEGLSEPVLQVGIEYILLEKVDGWSDRSGMLLLRRCTPVRRLFNDNGPPKMVGVADRLFHGHRRRTDVPISASNRPMGA